MFKLIYVPVHFYHSHGYSGPWTMNDTKIAIAILLTIVLAYIVTFLLNCICNKHVKIKNILNPTNGYSTWFLTDMMYLFAACISGMGILSYIGYLIYSLL